MTAVTIQFEHAIGDPVEIIHAGDIQGRVCAHINNVDGKQYRVLGLTKRSSEPEPNGSCSGP